MRAFVRLLPRVLLLGVAAAALLVLAERERSAHADLLSPLTTPAPPAAPVPTPPDGPGLPGVPEVPDATAPDSGSVTGAVPPLPGVPEVAPPERLLPDLPSVPDLADVPMTLERVLELGVAPAPDASAVADAPGGVPSTLLPEPASAPLDPSEPGGLLVGTGADFAAARAPRAKAPGSPQPCPGGRSPHPTQTDATAFPEPAASETTRRAGSHAEARAYASALLCEPILRPD